jgi:hypothetical protein
MATNSEHDSKLSVLISSLFDSVDGVEMEGGSKVQGKAIMSSPITRSSRKVKRTPADWKLKTLKM